jgi:hypothetical protein
MHFSNIVQEHINEYTVPQFGDQPDDHIESWSAEDCIRQIEKYVERFGSNQRGAEEQFRDMLKIAHYAELAYEKLEKKGNLRMLGNEEIIAEGDFLEGIATSELWMIRERGIEAALIGLTVSQAVTRYANVSRILRLAKRQV